MMWSKIWEVREGIIGKLLSILGSALLLNLYLAIVSFACVVSACLYAYITTYTKSPMLYL